MSSQGLSISQAARKLGVSTRTVRRYIKAGKIKAELVSGQFGEEYRILELPPELYQVAPEGETPTPGQPPGQTLGQAVDIIRELQDKNLTLAAQLGAATERIRNLENQVKLLTAARLPWWKRLFFRRAG
jgi:MerR family copper efflux transcriptional regulator